MSISLYPDFIQKLIISLTVLPGVGPKTAERYALSLLKQPHHMAKLYESLQSLRGNIVSCEICHDYTETSPCNYCSDTTRDRSILCVVAEPADKFSLERTGNFHGHYHVLGGLLAPTEGITPDMLRITTLVQRIQNNTDIKEVILAFDATMEGETTTLYLAKLLRPHRRRITRLARGLPVGAELEYSDEITLESALRSRKET